MDLARMRAFVQILNKLQGENMSDEIELSVVIPTCNRFSYLSEAIDSILHQREIATEIIVIDDSVDGSSEKIRELYPDEKLIYIKRDRPSNKRPALVRNQGAEVARGQYIYFLDDDDTSYSGALSQAVSELRKNPKIAMVYGRVVPFGNNPVKLEHYRKFFDIAARRARKLIGRNMFAAYHAYCPATFFGGAAIGRTDVFRKIEGFDASIPVAEDIELWLRMGLEGGFKFIDTPFLNYRTGEISLTDDVVKDDPVWTISYGIIQSKFVRQVGYMHSLILKVVVKIFSKLNK